MSEETPNVNTGERSGQDTEGPGWEDLSRPTGTNVVQYDEPETKDTPATADEETTVTRDEPAGQGATSEAEVEPEAAADGKKPAEHGEKPNEAQVAPSEDAEGGVEITLPNGSKITLTPEQLKGSGLDVKTLVDLNTQAHQNKSHQKKLEEERKRREVYEGKLREIAEAQEAARRQSEEQHRDPRLDWSGEDYARHYEPAIKRAVERGIISPFIAEESPGMVGFVFDSFNQVGQLLGTLMNQGVAEVTAARDRINRLETSEQERMAQRAIERERAIFETVAAKGKMYEPLRDPKYQEMLREHTLKLCESQAVIDPQTGEKRYPFDPDWNEETIETLWRSLAAGPMEEVVKRSAANVQQSRKSASGEKGGTGVPAPPPVAPASSPGARAGWDDLQNPRNVGRDARKAVG
jgi:hypothetical protein